VVPVRQVWAFKHADSWALGLSDRFNRRSPHIVQLYYDRRTPAVESSPCGAVLVASRVNAEIYGDITRTSTIMDHLPDIIPVLKLGMYFVCSDKLRWIKNVRTGVRRSRPMTHGKIQSGSSTRLDRGLPDPGLSLLLVIRIPALNPCSRRRRFAYRNLVHQVQQLVS
jgi:hypothetical protein